jgi:hypothetical protein
VPDPIVVIAACTGLTGAGMVAAGVAGIVASRRASRDEQDRYRPRHYEATVEIRPAGWTPPIGARRISAQLDDTQIHERMEVEQ